MLMGGFYVHAFSPMMVQYSSSWMMTTRCSLVFPSSKWSEFTPTKMPTIYSYKFSMPSCVMSPTIQEILSKGRFVVDLLDTWKNGGDAVFVLIAWEG